MNGYWSKVLDKRLARRRLLAATGGMAAGSAFLAACGDSDDSGDSSPTPGSSPSGATGSPTATGSQNGLVTQPVDTTSQASAGGTFKWYLSSEPRSFEPGITDVTAFPHVARVYQALLMQQPVALSDGRSSPDTLQPYAADSWEYSPDRLTLTFKLASGLKWDERAPTNGRPLTADDVAYSWQRFTEISARRGELANSISPNAPVESVTATDDSTVVFKLAFPHADLLPQLRLWSGAGVLLVPREIDGGFDPRNESRGSGPWMLEEFTPASRVVWQRNPNFFKQDMIFPDRIEAPILTEYASALAQLKAGSIYTYNVRPEDLIQTKRDSSDLLMTPTPVNGANNFLFFGYGEGSPFRDVRVRQAFMKSLDRDAFIDTFYDVDKFRAEGLPVDTAYNTCINCNLAPWWLDPTSSEFGENSKFFQMDIEEAKALLNAAGYANGVDIDAPILTTPQYGATYYPMLEVMFGMAQEAGFNTNIIPIDYNTEWRPRVLDAKGAFSGVSAGGAGPLSRSFFSQLLDSDTGTHFKGFDPEGRGDASGDPVINDLVRKLMQEFDPETASSYAHDIQRYEAGMVYCPFFPGGASSFQLGWPALGNFGVFDGDTIFTKYWIDETKRPLGS